jgi:hypothetical protein
VQRGRPQTLLEGFHILGEPARGVGYVSGHSAVAAALAAPSSPTVTAWATRSASSAWARGASVVNRVTRHVAGASVLC